MATVELRDRDQRLYREVNKRIRQLSDAADGPVEFLCECGRGDCTTTIAFTHRQYDTVVGRDDCVLLAAEHADGLDGRRVVAENGRFVLVAAE